MGRITRMVGKQVTTTTLDTAGVTVLTTPWILGHGAASLRVAQILEQLAGSWRSKARYRWASVSTDRPGPWTTSATVRSTAAKHTEDFTVSGTTDKLWIQAAVTAYANAGVAEAYLRLQASIDGNSHLVSTRRLNVEPWTTTGNTTYIPITRPIKALGLTGLMGGFTLTGVSGTIAYGLAVRYFQDPDWPEGTYTDLASFSNITADEERNSGNQATTPGTNSWAQAAVKFSGTDARGILVSRISAKY